MPTYLRIRELREARGWSQAELADRAGVRQATVSAIEQQTTRSIEFAVLEQLADALGVDPGFLIVRSPVSRRSR